jgi:TolA-binding protein
MTTLGILQVAAQDTVASITIRDGYDLLQSVAAGAALALYLGALLLIAYSLMQVKRTARAIRRTGERLSADPAVESIRRTTSNVESISQALQAEVAKLSESVSRLSDRLTQASDRMEERIEEFNAFMEVVQGEAEGAFVEGAARARGVRRGLDDLTGGTKPRSGVDRSEESEGIPIRESLPPDAARENEDESEGLGPSVETEHER